MAKEQNSSPKSLPNTTPAEWVMNASAKVEGSLGKFEGTLAGFQTQLDRVEQKLSDIDSEVRGIGRWTHTVKWGLAALAFLVSIMVTYVVGPWLKTKILGP